MSKHLTNRQLENYAFSQFDGAVDTFDPDNFDPDNFDEDEDSFKGKKKGIGTKQVRGGQAASFNITITNQSTTLNLTAELFNALNSFLLAQNTTYANGVVTYVPSGGIVAADGTGVCGFTKDGHVVVTGTSGDHDLSITCEEIAYKALLESSKIRPFIVEKLRMSFTTAGQIDNKVTYFSKSWLGGVKENNISPRQFFKPDQFQTLIVDVPVNLPIDGEAGIKMVIKPSETVRINFIVMIYEKTNF